MKGNLVLNKIFKKCGNWSEFGRIMKDYAVKNALIKLLWCNINYLIQNDKDNLL